MSNPIFADPTGRRWRALRRAVLALGVVTTMVTLSLVVYLLVPPVLPKFADGVQASRNLAQLPVYRGTRAAREREAERRRLFSSLEKRPQVPALRPASIPIRSVASTRRVAAADAEFAAFYVNWDDNAFSSLREHAADIDWLVAEWAFVAPTGDSLRILVDRRVPFLLSTLPAENRPRILAMISNFDSVSQRFDARRIASLVGRESSRQRAAQQIATVVHEWGLAGVSLDFEEIPDNQHAQVRAFLKALRTALNAVQGSGPPLVVSMSVAADMAPAQLSQYAALNDRIFLMLYDEHYGKG